MSDGVWRNFRFFESEALPAAAALAELNVVCTCLTPTSLVVGDYEGQVFFLARHKSDTATAAPASRWCFQAYAGPVTHVRYCAQRNALLTIGDDDALNTTILRVWDLDQLAALYTGLLDHHPSAATAAPTGSPTAAGDAAAPATALRWRPPCQEHRLLPAAARSAAAAASAINSSGSSSAAAAVHSAGEELPLVPILLDEARQLQYHFKPTTAPLAGSSSNTSAAAAASPPPPSSSSGNGTAATAGAVSCGSIRSAVVSFDVAADLSCAAVGLVTRECVVLTGDLAKERAVRALTIRSGIAKGALTLVGLPSPACVTLPAHKGTAAAEGGAAAGAGGAFALLTGGSGRGAAGVSGSAAAAAPPAVPVLFTVFEDVVTCWALRASGHWSEYPCPTPGGAPRFGAALNAHGELLLLARHTTIPATGAATHGAAAAAALGSSAAGSRVVRLGGAAAPYDPTAKSSVQTIDVDHVPGRCFLYAHRQYLALLVQHDGRPEQYQLQCFDLTYRIRGLTRPQEAYANCAAVLGDGADLLVLFLDPAVRTRQLALRGVRLRETDTQTKLELLFSKECYGIAQQLAQTMDGADPTLQLRIRKRYGDYLYGKGKLVEAMTQYVDTIGHLESSYVIRRYMGSAHMEQLIRYLEELHNQRHSGHANVAHTTLLLTCYSKQQDEARLSAFIHRDDVRFDAKNAIEVCREGGYAAAALYLADRYAAVHDCARIRLYDMQAPLETLTFVRTLGVDEAEAIAAELGKDLLRAAPRAATELLMELCVYWKGPGRRLVEPSAAGSVTVTTTTTARAASTHFSDAVGLPGAGEPRHPHRANASAFLHIFVDTPVCLLNFLRAVVASGVLDEEERESKAAPADIGAQGTASGAAASGVSAAPLGPHVVLYNTLLELFMTRTLKNTLQLVPSRRGGIPAGGGEQQDGEDERATPLSALGDFPPEPYERRLEQARTFLEAYKGRYDPHVALGLAHQHRFQDGILYLLRGLGLSEEILGYYSATLSDPAATSVERHEAAAKLLEACRESPASDSGTAAMWMTLLARLVRSPTADWLDVVKVLDYIEAHDALPPVVVLEILSNNPHSALDLRTVRDYCQRCLQKQTRQVREVQARTAQRLGEVERVKQEVVALQTTAVVFQSTTCAHCYQALDTPAVYFMCKHAFHHRCLYTPTECNVCAAAHRRRLEAIHTAEQRDLQQQDPSSFTAQFFQDVKRGRPAAEGSAAGTTQDGFGVVTDYIARGVLGAPPLCKDAGLFGYEPTVPLRPSDGRHRGAEEETLRADDLDVW